MGRALLSGSPESKWGPAWRSCPRLLCARGRCLCLLTAAPAAAPRGAGLFSRLARAVRRWGCSLLGAVLCSVCCCEPGAWFGAAWLSAVSVPGCKSISSRSVQLVAVSGESGTCKGFKLRCSWCYTKLEPPLCEVRLYLVFTICLLCIRQHLLILRRTLVALSSTKPLSSPSCWKLLLGSCCMASHKDTRSFLAW